MTDTCCRERIEKGLKKDQEADLEFQKRGCYFTEDWCWGFFM